MSNKLVVIVDGQPQLEFDHSKTVPDQQLAFIDRMDMKMDAGFELDDGFVASPNAHQKAKFVARNMAIALGENNEQMAVAMCTYLGVRRPELKQVKITSNALGVEVDLDHKSAYEPPAPEPQVVTFTPQKH